MFIRVYDVTDVQIQFNCSKLCNFICLQKMVKNTIKFYRFFFNKTNQKKAKKTRGEMFHAFAGMTSLTVNLELCTRLFIHKINKNMPGLNFWPQVPFKE